MAKETGPLLVHAEDKVIGLTDAGLAMVERLAARGEPMRLIASSLGVTLSRFEKLIGSADVQPPSEVRLRWEAGHARHESAYRKLLWRHAKRHPIPAIFYGKSVFSMKDSGMQVDIKEDRRIQLYLPKPMQMGEFFKNLGIEGPLDFRRDKTKPHPMLKDVTPSAGPRGLPAPASGSDPLAKTDATSRPVYPPGRYSRSRAAHMKSQGAWNPAIHTIDE